MDVYKNQEVEQAQVDIYQLVKVVWKYKLFILLCTLMITSLVTIYATRMPDVYKAEALLAPVESDNGNLGNISSQLGGLASLAGVNLGGSGGIDKTTLALEILQSRAFSAEFISKHNLLVPLMASSGWSRKSGKLHYDESVYDKVNEKWVRDVSLPLKAKPSLQEAALKLNDLMKVSRDKDTSVITISVRHFSPELAKRWLDWAIEDINSAMRKRDLIEAKKSIQYLEEKLSITRVKDLKDALYQLIQEQEKIIMFANIREEYIFKVIDPPLVPEMKHEPKRAVICILAAFIGFLFSCCCVIFLNFTQNVYRN